MLDSTEPAGELPAGLPSSADDDPVEAPPDNRRGARQLALQAMYWEASDAGDARAAVSQLAERFSLSASVAQFAADLVAAAEEHRERTDQLIQAHATHWRQERMARVDLLILRLALSELLSCDDVPARATINEAVELAKTFSTDASYAFVNGVLDAIARDLGLTQRG